MNKIRKLFEALFNSCQEIEKVGIWVSECGVNGEDFTVNGDSRYDFDDESASKNLNVIMATQREFHKFDGPEKKEISDILEGLYVKYNQNLLVSPIANAIAEFDFGVEEGPFKDFLGKRFPWKSLKNGVWFEIYRDGKVTYAVDGEDEEE